MSTLKQLLPIVLGIAMALSVAAGATTYALHGSPRASPAAVASDSQKTTQLVIPVLGINAEVEAVGRAANGAMANPSTFYTVAWFREGTPIGERGSAVIAGHLDNALGLRGVFKDLDTLRPGDEVLVQTADGEEFRYRVVRSVEYPYDNVPLSEVFDRADGSYLNLITCAGTWLSDERTYDRRRIVYTELITE